MSLSDALFPLLLIMPIVDWTATVILMRLTRRQRGISFLTERTFAAFALSVVTTIYALVSLNTQLHFPVVDQPTAQAIARTAIIFLGIGPVVWLVAYLRLNG